MYFPVDSEVCVWEKEDENEANNGRYKLAVMVAPQGCCWCVVWPWQSHSRTSNDIHAVADTMRSSL